MAYIGKEPVVGNFQVCDSISVVNGQAAYTLQVSSTNVVPESSQHCLVSLNGILQAPVTSFTVSGSTLTFASNLATNDVIDFVILLGNVLDLGVPSDGVITNAKLSGDLISGETDIGGAIADADLFLLDDGAGGTLRKTAASRIKTYVGGGITVADQWRLTANITGTNAVISANLEQCNTSAQDGASIGSAMSHSSGVWTFPSTGKYWVMFHGNGQADSAADNMAVIMEATTNNSSYSDVAYGTDSGGGAAQDQSSSIILSSLIDVTDTSNVKVRFETSSFASGSYLGGDGDINYSTFTFIRLGDT